jgi:thiosulfate reductase cytochrome b subunit
LLHCSGGYQTARLEHFWLTMLLLAFFFVHIAQVQSGLEQFSRYDTGYDRSPWCLSEVTGSSQEKIRKGSPL